LVHRHADVLIHEKALQISGNLGITDFVASPSWVLNSRNVIAFKNISATAWMNTLVFKDWLTNFNQQMKKKFAEMGRTENAYAWLLLDYSSTHAGWEGVEHCV